MAEDRPYLQSRPGDSRESFVRPLRPEGKTLQTSQRSNANDSPVKTVPGKKNNPGLDVQTGVSREDDDFRDGPKSRGAETTTLVPRGVPALARRVDTNEEETWNRRSREGRDNGNVGLQRKHLKKRCNRGQTNKSSPVYTIGKIVNVPLEWIVKKLVTQNTPKQTKSQTLVISLRFSYIL